MGKREDKTEVQVFLEEVLKGIGVSSDQMKPLVDKFHAYATVDSMREITDERWIKLELSQYLLNAIKKQLSVTAPASTRIPTQAKQPSAVQPPKRANDLPRTKNRHAMLSEWKNRNFIIASCQMAIALTKLPTFQHFLAEDNDKSRISPNDDSALATVIAEMDLFAQANWGILLEHLSKDQVERVLDEGVRSATGETRFLLAPRSALGKQLRTELYGCSPHPIRQEAENVRAPSTTQRPSQFPAERRNQSEGQNCGEEEGLPRKSTEETIPKVMEGKHPKQPQKVVHEAAEEIEGNLPLFKSQPPRPERSSVAPAQGPVRPRAPLDPKPSPPPEDPAQPVLQDPPPSASSQGADKKSRGLRDPARSAPPPHPAPRRQAPIAPTSPQDPTDQSAVPDRSARASLQGVDQQSPTRRDPTPSAPPRHPPPRRKTPIPPTPPQDPIHQSAVPDLLQAASPDSTSLSSPQVSAVPSTAPPADTAELRAQLERAEQRALKLEKEVVELRSKAAMWEQRARVAEKKSLDIINDPNAIQNLKIEQKKKLLARVLQESALKRITDSADSYHVQPQATATAPNTDTAWTCTERPPMATPQETKAASLAETTSATLKETKAASFAETTSTSTNDAMASQPVSTPLHTVPTPARTHANNRFDGAPGRTQADTCGIARNDKAPAPQPSVIWNSEAWRRIWHRNTTSPLSNAWDFKTALKRSELVWALRTSPPTDWDIDVVHLDDKNLTLDMAMEIFSLLNQAKSLRSIRIYNNSLHGDVDKLFDVLAPSHVERMEEIHLTNNDFTPESVIRFLKKFENIGRRSKKTKLIRFDFRDWKPSVKEYANSGALKICHGLDCRNRHLPCRNKADIHIPKYEIFC
eukprot:GEMP01012200.1.p1 GENE.GEMP01012200.1~~GEMP01012200.1.p1  ORF type:complete len:900 (+),score=198.44 GEMP01012200.1:103-2700(+)